MFIGIDLGGTNIKGILTDNTGKELSYKETTTPESNDEIETEINLLVEQLATSASVSKIDIKAIGIGAAGSIDRNKGVIVTSPNINALKNYPITKNIEKQLGAKVFLENDATVAVAGGWWKGEGNKFRNWIMLTLGTGIGGGIIIDNKIYTGQSGSSMEVGHMTIDFNGKKCSCGNLGCFEQYASATALTNLVKQNMKKNTKTSIKERIKNEELTSKLVYEEALKGDEFAKKSFEEIATFLGIGISNLINIFNPEAIIFVGGLSEGHKLLFPTIKKVIGNRSLPGLKENFKLIPQKDQSKITALGAVKVAIDSFNAIEQA
ncbi:ROK family protein [Spirochaetota bacterium]